MVFWGVDLGGTKIEAVVLDPDHPDEPLIRKRIQTEAHNGYSHIMQQIHTLIKTIAGELGLAPDKIGIGTPGSLDPHSKTLKNSNTTCLNGKPVKQDLENLLEIPVVIANDANCFALGKPILG